MNQPDQTKHTKVKQRNHNRNRNGNREGAVKFIAPKPSNIPLPTEQEDKKLMVLKWGNKNEYPYFINYLFKKNPIHAGIIRKKVHFTVSGGLTYEGANQIAYDEFFKNRKSSPKDKDLKGLIDDISLDYEKFNLFILRVRFSFVGTKKYRKLERIPVEKVRLHLVCDEANNYFLSGNLAISDNWLCSEPKYEVLKPYNPKDPAQTSCFVMFQEESGQSIDDPSKLRELNPGHYPDPPYGGGITAIETGIQIGVYNNSEIHNGFSLGTMIYLANGKIKNDKEKKDLERDLGASTTGALQSGRSMVIYGNGQDEKPTIEALNGNNLPDRYSNSKKGSEESILHAHQVIAPTLFGKMQEGSFNASELEAGYYIMQKTYFQSRREDIATCVTWVMNDIAMIRGNVIINEPEFEIPMEEVAPAQPQFNVNMGTATVKETDVILERLQSHGRNKSAFTELYSHSMSDGERTKDELFSDYRSQFANLSKDVAQTLNLINQGEDFDSIRKALDVTGKRMADIYQELIDADYITPDGEMTSAGKKQASIEEIDRMEILYEYRLRPNAPALVAGGSSRPFCETLMGLNRVYTRDEINQISGIEGYDVFAYRGGWYTNPNSGKHEPGCRHEWAQIVTIKKN